MVHIFSYNRSKTPLSTYHTGHLILSLVLRAPALRLRYLLIRIRTPRSRFPLSLAVIMIVIVIMAMSIACALSPRWPCGSIIPRITITTRVARALISRLIDSLRSVVYAADCLSLASCPLQKQNSESNSKITKDKTGRQRPK